MALKARSHQSGKMELISELFCLSELSQKLNWTQALVLSIRVSAQYVKEEMGLYFIGKRIKNVSAFKNIKSMKLKRSA